MFPVFCLQIDYFERARHLEEIPLIEALYESEKVELKKFWDETEAEKVSLLDILLSAKCLSLPI